MRYSNFTKEDEARFLDFTKKGITALFVYTDKIIHNGERTTYTDSPDDRAIAYSGVIYAPIALFVDFLGAKLDNDTLALNGNTVKVSYDKKEGYLPVEDTCQELGLSTRLFCDESFLLIGDCSDIDESLINAGPYALFGDYETDSFTYEDYENVARNFHDKLVGTKESNDLSIPVIREKIAAIEEKCKNALDTLDRSGDPIVLWGTKPLRDTEDGARQYSYVRALTFGYGTYGSKYYLDKDVFNDIIYCLEWMYRHAYGDDMIEGHGWRDPKLPNWWYMYIGAPEHLADILLVLYNEISLEDRRRYLKCFEWIASWMCLGPAWRVTRIKICTEYGILLHEPKYLIQEAEDFDAALQLKRSDYVDFTHTYPHNMSYGGIYMSRFMYIASVLAGSPIAYNSPNAYKQFLRVKYMYEPATYQGQAFFMLSGRYTKELVEASKSANFLVYLLSMLGVYGEDEDKYIKQFLKRHSAHPDFKNTIIKSATFVELARYMEILNDDSIPYEYYYEYAHAWYTGDRAAQHRNDYAFGIAMASNRHINYESILHENKTGWYTGDGAFHVYTSYDRNQYDGNNFINNINIAYRFPGTTEDMQERVARGISFGPWKSPNTYAGSMQLENKYIAAAMEFVSEYCDGDTEEIYDEVRGWSRAEHHNDLTCKKAWFCFDKEAVLLGSAITSTMNSPVNTIAAHRRIVNDDKYTQYICADGNSVAVPKSEFQKRYTNPEYFLWSGHAGYVFLTDTELLVNRYNYTTNVEQPYLELRIEHGANPCGAKYAFAVLPYATEEDMKSYSKAPEVEIISNTDTIQAVRKSSLGISSYAFYQGGKCENVATSDPAIISLTKRESVLEVAICEPTHLLSEITVTIDGEYAVLDVDMKASVSVENGNTIITYKCEGEMGRSARIKLKA